MKAVYSTTLLLDALLRQAALRAHGIESVLWNELSAFYAIGLPTGAVPLVLAVGPADAEKALDVLREELACPAPRPDAGSDLLEGRIRRATDLGKLALLIYLLLHLKETVVAYVVLMFAKLAPLPPEDIPPEEFPPESWVRAPCPCGRVLELPEGDEESLAECPWCGRESGRTPTAEEPRPQRPKVGLAIGLGALALLFAIAGAPPAIRLVLRRFESGTELSYRVLYPETFEGNRQETAEETLALLLHRARKAGIPADGSVEDRDHVSLRIGVTSPVAVAEAKRLLGRHVGFGLYPVAPKEVQERYNEDQAVPDGFRAWPNPSPYNSPEYAAWSRRIVLLAEEPVVDGRNLVSATSMQIYTFRSPEWVVCFELDLESSRRFDEAARGLYHRKPPGMIAVVIDGAIHSMPVILAETFGGSGQITGMKGKREAEELAALLSSGELPFPVGRIENGKPVPGEPEKESRYGPGK